MADDPKSYLIKRLHILRNRAPTEFVEMQNAMNAWAGAKLALVTSIPPDGLQQFQGQMQAIELMLTFLKDSKDKPID